jgi:hypothetical protein
MLKKGLCTLSAIVIGLAMLMTAGLAVADEGNVPLKGSFGTSFSLISTSIPGVFQVPVNGTGSISKLGNITISVDQLADFRTNPPTVDGTFAITTVSGDTLVGASTGFLSPPDVNGFAEMTVTLTFTGGTGSFRGVTGSATSDGLTHLDTLSGGTGLFDLMGGYRR